MINVMLRHNHQSNKLVVDADDDGDFRAQVNGHLVIKKHLKQFGFLKATLNHLPLPFTTYGKIIVNQLN